MEVFENKQYSWGLRGDPELWEELKKKFKYFDYSKSPKEFNKILKKEFDKIIDSGVKKSNDTVYFEKYSQGGMSGGHISLEWWENKGLPLLKKRYFDYHKEIDKDKEEKHPFGDFVNSNSEILIVGSFPCFNGKDYGNWFYSGSGKNDFWKLLSEVFGTEVETKKEKEHLCKMNKIAITDIGYIIKRKKGNCSDSNLQIVEFNKTGINKCLSSNIRLILFTSKFVEKHFVKFFNNLSVKTEILPSPSPSANRYFASLDDYKKQVKKKEVSSIYEYKLNRYKKFLKI